MRVESSEKIPIKMWLKEIEDGALNQAKNLANLPFAFKHIAIMPDSHQGYGMPIGGVMATKGVIIPNAVGVDIGCGMCAVKTSLTISDVNPYLKTIMSEIRKVIPVGKISHKEKQDEELMPRYNKVIGEWDKSELPGDGTKPYNYYISSHKIINEQYENALKSLGTLGGGNHFIEIQKGNDGHIWIMINSGSRNLGFKVANHYNNLAKKLNKKWYSSINPKWDLAFLPINSDEGKNYIKEMNYCVEFALANRKLMMDRVISIFKKCIEHFGIMGYQYTDNGLINIAHNYAKMENHFGENVMVHRKGATLASEKTIGIIPGSQGTKSYIVRGKGNKDSFNSCSHGAGRTMSRSKAEEELNLKNEIKILEDQGIIHSIRNKHDLDEAPSAYKDISKVMDNQKDLVEVLVELSPLAVIKG